MTEYTRIAVENCSEELRSARERGKAGNILIGAGCSISCGIPSAAKIIEIISETYPHTYSKIDSKYKDDYRHVIDLLPLNERRDLIIDITSNKKVNWGYIALARLMESGFIDRVLNLNFDLQLQRACSLIGFHPAVYDFSHNSIRDFDLIASPSIAHLHGQSFGLIQLNDEKQTNDHMKRLRPLLSNSLASAPLTIIGYSGESDQLFRVLEREYRGREFLTWLGYDFSAKPHLSKLMRKKHARYFGSIEFDSFMVSLAIELGCWPPRIVSEPIKFVSSWIENIALFKPSSDEQPIDLKYIASDKLSAVIKDWKTKYSKFPEFEKLMLSLDYNSVIKKFERSRNKKAIVASVYHKGLISWAYSEASYHLWNDVANRRIAEKAEVSKTLRVAKRYIDKAISLSNKKIYFNNKLNIILLSYLTSKNVAKLNDAVNYFESIGKKSQTGKILYNAIAIYIEEFKISASLQTKRKVKVIWRKLKKKDPSKVYNYLCFCAVSGDTNTCKELAKIGFEAGTLPSVAFMKNDVDLTSISNERWFNNLCNKYG